MTARDSRTGPDALFERLTEYFQGSRFEYLALDYAGSSLRFSRARPRSDGAPAAEARTGEVLAPGVGFIELPPGRDRFPQAGERVAEGEPLFAIRRFRDALEVTAPAAGTLASIQVNQGAFVEFGQPLASVGPPE